jgi:hypothetical protein
MKRDDKLHPQMSYDYTEDISFSTLNSVILAVLGHDLSQFQSYLPQLYTIYTNHPHVELQIGEGPSNTT